MTKSKVGIINQFYFRYISVELDEFILKDFLYQHILIFALLEPEILRSLTSCFCAFTRSVTVLLNPFIIIFKGIKKALNSKIQVKC